ncbi:MAG TPA: PKD domain-containing protein [Saprospiraceae bacterium]|nr:PKD domain-containing protein [Saprospiraceae bacterium]
MRTNLYTIILFLTGFTTIQAQLTTPDSFCIFIDNIESFNVLTNDAPCNNTAQCIVFPVLQDNCFRISSDGDLSFIGDPKTCCGIHNLSYFIRIGNETSDVTEVTVEVKCPKPDCSFVELPTQQGSAGTSPQGGCLSSCENSTATYFVPHILGNQYLWTVIGGTMMVVDSGEIKVNWGPTGSGFINLVITNGTTVTVFDFCVDILEGPTASFTKTDSIFCLGSSISFTNTSSPNSTSFYWDFGDGNYSNDVHPTHIYTTPGMYMVTLVATKDNYGPNGEALCCCSDTMTMKVTIDDKPGPDILWISTVCEGDSVKYWTTTTGCTLTWTVKDANGNILPFTGQGNDTICVVWPTGPIGQISLQLSGCVPNIYCTQPVTVNVPVIQNVSTISGPMIVCAGQKATYSLPKWKSVLYHWNVMGGMIVSQDTNAHTITIMWDNMAPMMGMITGTYESKFLNDLPNHEEGDCSGMATLKVSILDKYGLAPDPNTTVCVGDVSTLTTVVAGPQPINGYTWTSSPPLLGFPIVGPTSISITWPSTGVYTICVSPNAPNPFCNNLICRSYNVMTIPPPDSISGPMTFCPGDTLTYFGHSNESNKKFVWNITGGVIVGGSNPYTGDPIKIVWNNAGPYSISLAQMMLNNPNCMSTPIINIPTKKGIIGSPSIMGTTACLNTLNNYAIAPMQDPDATYTWSLSNPAAGSIVGQGSPNISIQWNNIPGTFTLTCVISICATNLPVTATFTLLPINPPIITMSGFLCPGGTATLNTSGFSSYLWSTSGTSSSIPISLPGTYTVTATNGGCSSIGSFTANTSPLPVANISTPSLTNLCINGGGSVVIYAFYDPSYTYTWTCNGNPPNNPPTVVSVATLTHTNNNVDMSFVYQVKVTDPATGCMNTSNIITVNQDTCTTGTGNGCNPSLVSGNVTLGSPMCNQATFSVSPNFSVGSWNFADFPNNGYTGPINNPTHDYTSAGCRVVYAYGTSPDINTGLPCPVSQSIPVCIPVAPKFTFTNMCDTFCFQDLSTVLPIDNIIGWSWDFGDFTPPSSMQNPKHVYSSSGLHTVTLTVFSMNGCVVTTTLNVNVPVKPVATFIFSPNPICINQAATFTPTNTTNILSYTWDFGDLTGNNASITQHTYMTATTYTISLTVVDIFGCSNSSSQTITVTPMVMYGPIMVSDDEICQSDTAILTAPLAVMYNWSNGATTQSISVTSTGTYSVTVTDSNGCTKAIAGVDITVFPLPDATISGSHFICDGDCITLNGSQYSGATYQWFNQNLIPGPGLVFPNLTICGTSPPDTVYFQITDMNGCVDLSAPWFINSAMAPAIMIIANDTLCEGTPNLLTVSPILPNVVYQWSTGATSTSILVTAAGTYSAIATDTISGCSSKVSEIVHPLPDLCYVPQGCYKVCTPFKLCGPEGLAMYQWCFNGLPITPNGNMSMLMATQPGTYNLKAYTSFGCVDTSGALILETMLCCEDENADITATPLPSSSNGCCFDIGYYLGMSPISSVTFTATNANMVINFPSLASGYQILGSTSNSVTIGDVVAVNPLDTGTVSSLIDLCFNNFSIGPVVLIANWYDSTGQVVCMDTIELDCQPEGCIFIANDSIYCGPESMVYEVTVCNSNSSPLSVGYLVMNPLSPAGIPIGPLTINLLTPLLPGQCTTLVYNFPLQTFENQNLCFNLTAHEQNPIEHPEALCCSLDSIHCIFIPGCGPCDSVYVHSVTQVTEGIDSCCFDIILNNYATDSEFTNLIICSATTGQTLSMNTIGGTNWNLQSYTPSQINLEPLTPFVPTGYEPLPTICINESSIEETDVVIKWVSLDGTTCTDSITMSCTDCAEVETKVYCKDNKWVVEFYITNHTAFNVSNAYLQWCDPTLAAYNQNIPLGNLSPMSTYGPITIVLGSPFNANTAYCFNIILHDLDGNVCCKTESNITLPDCDQEPNKCLCDKEFESQAEKGIMCTNVGQVYTFKPNGTFDPECDKIIWSIIPLGIIETTYGNSPFVFTFTTPGDFEICMLIYRTDVNGKECKFKYIKQLVIDDFLPPRVYPNPSSSRLYIETGALIDAENKFEIYNNQGMLVKSLKQMNVNHLFDIDISGLNTGIYTLKMINDKRIFTKTFVKIE